MENRAEIPKKRAADDPQAAQPWRWPEEKWRRLATQVQAGQGACLFR